MKMDRWQGQTIQMRVMTFHKSVHPCIHVLKYDCAMDWVQNQSEIGAWDFAIPCRASPQTSFMHCVQPGTLVESSSCMT